MSGPMEVMKKSSKLVVKVPSNGKWANLELMSRAAVGVLPGFGLALLLVPSHLWAPPEGVDTTCPREKTLPSKIVVVKPSMRRLTFWNPNILKVHVQSFGPVSYLIKYTFRMPTARRLP